MTVFTQQFGFRLPWWGRALIFAAYAAGAGVMYAERGFGRLYEVLFIPVALYGGALALIFLTRLFPARSGKSEIAYKG